MHLVDLTLAAPEENLALDEQLLNAAEDGSGTDEVLRLWEPRQNMVVVGRSSSIEQEVDTAACAAAGVCVHRRCSGGLSIVTGPGCLMYAIVLSLHRRPDLRFVDRAHCIILGALRDALRPHLPHIEIAGTSDLAWRGRKFSGNSLRVKRNHLLYHGTLLYDFPLELIGRFLRMPPRAPAYRAGREHGEFVTNVPLSPGQLRGTLVAAFEGSFRNNGDSCHAAG